MTSVPDANRSASPVRLERIVAIGASAGGLEPIQAFLEHVRLPSHSAYIVVQHLDPTHKALLATLLQRVTPMPVREAVDGLRIEADHVYVIPPNTELTLSNAVLTLEKPAEPRGVRLPINVLFSSIAQDQGERAVGVVLSGMGADGTLGLQALKAVGALTAAQAPATAQFDAMPASAINSGCVDVVASPANLPARIASCVALAPRRAMAGQAPAQEWPLEPIFELLRQRTRHDFSLYKPSTIRRRIQRRMAIHGMASQVRYTDYLRENTTEVDLLFHELLIGVTRFFRDAPVWEHLADTVLPALLERRPANRKLRAWVVGCSTGEEAYSLGMVLTEVLAHQARPGPEIQIFASDLSPDAIANARRGQYPPSILEHVSSERLARFFELHETGYRVKQSLRDMVLFAQHDVVLDPPFTRLDILSCRNLMIYFDAKLQRRLIPMLHYTLRPGGIMVLGSSETVGRFERLFTAIDSKLRLYVRRDDASDRGVGYLVKAFPPLLRKTKEISVTTTREPGLPPDTLQAAADRVLLQVYAPAAVVVSDQGDIVYISGRTGKYLEPAAGKANWNFHAMVREGLRGPVASALLQAQEQEQEQTEPVQLPGLQVSLPGGVLGVDVTVQALSEPAVLKGMSIIVFHDVPLPGPRRRRGRTETEAAHGAELQQYRDEIQQLREEARASREELQSANEELQSTNEELQSTNEELTSSKEEMQSMNEELQTNNAEMQAKLDDLALAQSDMKNLLNSTEIAMLFLDEQLNVRRYTDRAAKIISLRESDIGRPLTDLTSHLEYPSLHDDTLETLQTLVPCEKQIQSTEGRWFAIRIMPYRRLDNVIDGVVITFVDITATKALETRLRAQSGGDE